MHRIGCQQLLPDDVSREERYAVDMTRLVSKKVLGEGAFGKAWRPGAFNI